MRYQQTKGKCFGGKKTESEVVIKNDEDCLTAREETLWLS